MAARENQGYLIAVIILVLLSLVLALVSFLGVQKAYEQAEAAEASEGKLQVSRFLADAETLKGEALKAIIGDLGTTPAEIGKIINDLQQISTKPALADSDKKIVSDIIEEVRTAQAIYKVEVSTDVSNGEGEDTALATLRSRITDLTSLVDRMRKDYEIQVRQTNESDRDFKERIAQKEAALQSATKELADANQKLLEEKENSLVKENTLKAEVEASKQAISELTRKSEEAAQLAANKIREANNQVQLLTVDNTNLKIKINQLTNEVFDHPDGDIVRVAQKLKTVFINIGSADGLTNNRTFAVYDNSVTNFEEATAKGSVEVVRVFPFRAEARIISDVITDPILTGDYVLTPVWDPGFALKVALAGRFDLDNDRFDDTDKLVRLIERNGGQVVARHDEKGKITGEITPEVRFLVKGNKPLIGGVEDDADAGKILNALREMEASAEKNTVQVIDLQKMLNRMGVRAQPKTTQLDFPPGGFVPRQPGGSSSREGSSTR